MVDKYFTGTTSSIEGIDMFQVADEAIRIHKTAFGDKDPVLETMLDAGGEYGLARARRRAHVDPGRHREAPAIGAAELGLRPTRNTRRSSTNSRCAT